MSDGCGTGRCELCARRTSRDRFCSGACGRAHARLLRLAMGLLTRGEVDGETALAMVVWPSAAVREALLGQTGNGPAESEYGQIELIVGEAA